MRKLPLPLAFLLLGVIGGCSAVDPSIKRMDAAVTPVPVGDTAAVPAIDLARAMLSAGFTPEEVLERGPSIRNALATYGGAEVERNNLVAAIFSVNDDMIYVTSRSRGTFVQPITSRRFAEN